MIEDTDHQSEEEETSIGFANFREQSEELANRNSTIDKELAEMERKVESLKEQSGKERMLHRCRKPARSERAGASKYKLRAKWTACHLRARRTN